MRKAWLVVFALAANPAWAGDEPAGPDPVAEAAKQVTAAVKAANTAALARLSSTDEPDPWLVTWALCRHGAFDAARAFAGASRRKAFERLPAYVDAVKAAGVDRKQDAASMKVAAAVAGEAWTDALQAAAAVEPDLASVPGIRIAYERGLALAHIGRLEEAFAAVIGAGDAARTLGWYTGARTAFARAARGAEEHDAPDAAIVALTRLIDVQTTLGDMAAAIQSRNSLGVAHRDLGRFPEAKAVWNEALAIAAARKDVRNEAILRINLAVIESDLGRPVAALAGVLHALKLTEALPDRELRARTLHRAAVAHLVVGHVDDSAALHRRAMKLLAELGDEAGAAKMLTTLGVARMRAGRFADAIAALEDALARFEKLSAGAGIARVHGQLSVVHCQLGDLPRCLAHAQASRRAAEEAGDGLGVAYARKLLGAYHADRGDHAQALEEFRAAVALYERLGSEANATGCRLNLAATLANLGRLDEAEPVFRRLREVYARSGQRRTLSVVVQALADIHSWRGEDEAAMSLFEEALDLLRKKPEPDRRVRILESIARHHLRRGQYAASIEAARDAIVIVERIVSGLADKQSAQALEWYSEPFDIGARAAIKADDVEALLHFGERARGTFLRKALRARSGGAATAEVPASLRAEAEAARRAEAEAVEMLRAAEKTGARAEVKAARRRLTERRRAREDVVARIERLERPGGDVGFADPRSSSEIRARLAPDEALLIYGLTTVEGVAVVLERKRARIVALGRTEEIARAAAKLDASDPGADLDAPTAALKALVADPIQLDDAIQRLRIAPMSGLSFLPFTLMFPEREVSYISSGSNYVSLKAAEVARGHDVLGLGDPIYGRHEQRAASRGTRAGVNLAPLPHTRPEVEAIADVRLLGEKATESALRRAVAKEERWRAIHLACHGVIDGRNPLDSCLALTAEEDEDGFLTALEIFRGSFPADLVVLSACDTARGKVFDLEGTIGLPRAFMMAGTPRVICSLWSVDDEATRALMVKFYELWGSRADDGAHTGAAAALHRAQHYVRSHAKWEHPYYWAAWVLWGRPD